MKFPVHVSCGYPSYEEAGLKWEDLDFKAYNLVKAIKNEPFRGYAIFNGSRVDNTASGRATALRLAAANAAGRLKRAGLVAPLVAVPSSKHVEFGRSFTGQRLTEAISTADKDFRSTPVLRFKSEMKKSAGGGGTRDPAAIAANLDISKDVDFEECILVDDVTTTHGHLRGAARFLEKQGIRTVGAYCVAQTVNARPIKLFDIAPIELDSEPDWFDF